jgi:Spy/CpxP family protein refolding chaperone
VIKELQMPRIRIVVGVLALAAFSGGWLMGDDKKVADTKPGDAAAKHTLPQGWKTLGLSDDQKKKIYAVEDEYEPKIAALKKQIETLQTEERTKKYEVLTEDQKKRLKELRESKDGGGTDKKNDKKDDKKDDKKGEK